MYEHYDGDEDPRVNESEIGETFWDVCQCGECSEYWREQLLEDNVCPECGGETNTVDIEEFLSED